MIFPSKTANDLVPVLLEKSGILSQQMRDRIKVNGIYNEFDEKSTSFLKKYIEMSNKRYKGVKTGNNLETVLVNQRLDYDQLSDQIFKDKFFTNPLVENEVKKLELRVPNKENKDCLELRKGIIVKTKGFTNNELLKREQLVKSAKERNYGIFVNGRNVSFRHDSYNQGMNSNDGKQKLADSMEEENSFEIKKKNFKKLIEKDQSYIKQKLDKYKDYLNNVKLTETELSKLLRKNKDEFIYDIAPDKVKFLSYLEEEPVQVKIKPKIDNKIDILRLMRFTKRGNKRWFKNEIKEKSKKRLRSVNKMRPIFSAGIKRGIFKNFSVNDVKNSQNKSGIINQKQAINTQANSKSLKDLPNKTIQETPIIDYKNTIRTVKNEAQKAMQLEEDFDFKRNTMNGFIRDPEFSFSKGFLRKNKGKKNTEISVEKSENLREEEGEVKLKTKGKRDLRSEFKEVYSNKSREWEKDREILREKKEKNEAEREENNKYLNKVMGFERKKDLYVDYYSRRNDIINKRIHN